MPSNRDQRCEKAERLLARPLPDLRILSPDGQDQPRVDLALFSLETKLAMMTELRSRKPANHPPHESFSMDLSEFSLESRQLMLRDLQQHEAQQQAQPG
jgi:hypothetical protein